MTIGFFDSGVGGLYVMERVARLMPEYNYVFYGDTKHVPYGDKPEEEIYQLTRNAVWYLFSHHNAKLVIVACNTASAETLRRLQDEFLIERFPDRKILGVIIPTIEALIESGVKKPLLIGTTRTVASGKFDRELEKRGVTDFLESVATPALVQLIEEGKLDEACGALSRTLGSHSEAGGDALVLGCTHYISLTDRLRGLYPRLQIFSQAEIIPDKLRHYLERHNEITKDLGREGKRHIELSQGTIHEAHMQVLRTL